MLPHGVEDQLWLKLELWKVKMHVLVVGNHVWEPLQKLRVGRG